MVRGGLAVRVASLSEHLASYHIIHWSNAVVMEANEREKRNRL